MNDVAFIPPVILYSLGNTYVTHSYCVRGEIHLPNEILAIIINELASDTEDNFDRSRTLAALASCRLASHLLYSLATPLLFASIELTESLAPWDNPIDRLAAFKERATKLKQILTRSDIAASVHTLTLRCQKENLENWRNGTLISAILRRLPHIQKFILESGGEALDFTAITGDFTLAIKSLCRSPNLTTLDLENIIHFPITFITCASPNLQCLRLSRFRFDYYMNPIDEISNLQPYNLDSLEIDESSIESMGSGIYGLSCEIPSSLARHFSRIKNLRVKHIFYDNAALNCGWDIMLLASQSLTTLDLPWDDNLYYNTAFPNASETIPFDLGQFPALRHFKIQILIPLGDHVTLLRSLSQILSISSSTSGIETLEIITTWEDIESGCEKDLFSSDAGWPTLVEALSSERFVSLRKVVLGLRLKIWGYYHNQMNLEFGTSLTPPFVNSLFSMFRGLTSTQYTLELHVKII